MSYSAEPTVNTADLASRIVILRSMFENITEEFEMKIGMMTDVRTSREISKHKKGLTELEEKGKK